MLSKPNLCKWYAYIFGKLMLELHICIALSWKKHQSTSILTIFSLNFEGINTTCKSWFLFGKLAWLKCHARIIFPTGKMGVFININPSLSFPVMSERCTSFNCRNLLLLSFLSNPLIWKGITRGVCSQSTNISLSWVTSSPKSFFLVKTWLEKIEWNSS